MEIYPFLPLTAVVLLTTLFWRIEASLRLAWVAAGLITILCCLSDWYLLAKLPQLGLSFGPVSPPLFMINFIRLVPLLLALSLLAVAGHNWQRLSLLTTIAVFQLLFLAVLHTSLYVEPFRLTLTDLQLTGAPAFLPDRPLRILQLSDLHVEHITSREKAVLAKTEAISPDLIVLTGDFINKSYLKDSRTLQETRQWLSQLKAPYGVYAINGNLDSPSIMATLFDGLGNIRVLNDETLPISLPGGVLNIVGVTFIEHNRDYMKMESLLGDLPSNSYSLLLYHFPERMDVASRLGANLYLAGDTHGGQVRLPFIGSAVFTQLDNEYIMGKYQAGHTTLYVSRGLGMQGGIWPRIRLNCPPEMVLVSLGK